MIEARWEHFPHQADVGVRGFGANPAEAFEQAALAMAAIVADLADVEPRNEVEIACRAPDLELLLVDWLNALVYEMATQNMVFGRFRVDIGEGPVLIASAWGEPVDKGRHRLGTEVKGATMTALSVSKDGSSENWVAQCVVDV